MTETTITDIRDTIASLKPTDDLEKSHINDALGWIDTTSNIFRIKKPDVPPKHLVSYFVLVDQKHQSILLCDHIKAQLWLPSGSHVEKGENPADTVRREFNDIEWFTFGEILESDPSIFDPHMQRFTRKLMRALAVF